MLRSGLGLRHSYTREEVARILRVTLRQEGRLERQATTDLTNAPARGRCSNPAGSARAAVLNTVNALLALTRQAPPTGKNRVSSVSSGRRRARPGSGSPSTPARQPANPNVKSASITAPHTGGLDPFLLALALGLAAGLAAVLWLLAGRRRLQPGVAPVPAAAPQLSVGTAGSSAARRLRAGAGSLTGALNPGRAGQFARALAAAIGLTALREIAVNRRRDRRAAVMERRGAHRLALPPSPEQHPEHEPAEDAAAASAAANGVAGRDVAAIFAGTRIGAGEAAPAPSPSTEPLTGLAAGVEAFELGGALAEKGDLAGAEAAYRRADGQGHPAAASNLGVLLEQRGDIAGAEEAYRRADERNDPTGAFNLATMLAERNDMLGAEEAYRRADHRGDASAAFNLGLVMARRNDLFGAEAAFRRADERGHPSAPTSLGMLLEQRSDLTGAEAAYRRADTRGDATGAFKLGALLEARNDLTGAEAAYRRAHERDRGYVADLALAAMKMLRR